MCIRDRHCHTGRDRHTHTLVELGAVKCRRTVDITAAVDSKQARVVGLIKKRLLLLV